jgi:glycosyltransferase involved in cell wall biosynthesis
MSLKMRIAIVHEWLVTYAGSEKVLRAMMAAFPEADVFCLVDALPDSARDWLNGRNLQTSFLQRMPAVRNYYRYLLPLMPIAVEQFNLSAYDIVISNSHAVAKGVLTAGDQLHICYCYTPMRYAWELQHQYLEESGLDVGLKSLLARWMLHKSRMWDFRTSNSVDQFVACSHYIARRIEKAYRRDAVVIYPNVAISDFTLCEDKSDYYVTCSRIVPYKKINLIVEAFAKMPKRKLIVIGDGPHYNDLLSLATPNVSLLGSQPHEVLLQYLQHAKAFVFAAEEDFGIAPIEAQACGTPVLAYGRGGATETVVHGVTGYHFDEQTPESICRIVERFEKNSGNFRAAEIRKHACKFSEERFKRQFYDLVMDRYELHKRRIRAPSSQVEIEY